MNVLTKIFGTANDRTVRTLMRRVTAISAHADAYKNADITQLAASLAQIRQHITTENRTLDDALGDVFAIVREAAERTLGLRPFDVQLLGGIVLHEGKIAEMKTGEGKTLVATLPVVLNALTGKGVHVVTVNDYLAQRDSTWMGDIYQGLGLSVGCVISGMDDAARRDAYGRDITYATNNELGFDYLRDNMKFHAQDRVTRPYAYGIVDEVDSILIDEARTPLIISGPADGDVRDYVKMNTVVARLTAQHYEIDEKHRAASLTEAGQEALEDLLRKDGMISQGGLYDLANVSLVHHANQALRARSLFERDRDYIVKDGRVVIIDEFTGRMMEGRRFSEGLHQALEAKEGVTIQQENQTLASVTYQNYFRLYPKLAGMTGTAMTEAAEFGEIYNLAVISIPTNVAVNRNDEDDQIYASVKEKTGAIVDTVKDCYERGQPVLIGTVSIEKSESLAKDLKKASIPHQILNARFHEKEAHIIAQAGRLGAVTIATNMAGRGTDIQLGGNLAMRLQDAQSSEHETIEREIAEERERVIAAGGLCVIGTERHESRRIDNQLRGRSGRQGDPGRSIFFLSLQDDLMRIFASEKLQGMLGKLGLQDGEAIAHTWVNKALEKAQSRVEARNFELRKNLLRFDNVMNNQRSVIYEQRNEIMALDDAREIITSMRTEVIDYLIKQSIPQGALPHQWDTDGLASQVRNTFGQDFQIGTFATQEGVAEQEIADHLDTKVTAFMDEKDRQFTPELMRQVEKSILLQILDQSWKEHLLHLDHLRQGISLRAYGQKDPLREYQSEAFDLFEEMLMRVRLAVVRILSQVEVRSPPQQSILRRSGAAAATRASAPGAGAATPLKSAPAAPNADDQRMARPTKKIGRNDPCPCGSGKKYKHCHGRAQAIR
ncbi:MAG: preprotein translocase subunit SecA [Pseudomonadota bacterium]